MKNLFKQQSTLRLLTVLLFFYVTIGLYTPGSLFLSNIDEFRINYSQTFLYTAVPFLFIFIVIFVACYFLSKKTNAVVNIIINVIWGCVLGAYIQGNFLNFKLPTLNGTTLDLSSVVVPVVISSIAWILCLVLPFVFSHFYPSIHEKIQLYVSLGLSALQLFSFVVLLLTTSRAFDNNFVITKDNEFTLSKNQNVVVFVVDTLDAQWAEKYVIDNPQNSFLKDGFTYFNNVACEGAPTILGMPALLTGESYNPAEPIEEYYANAYAKSSLFKDLKANDFSINLYTFNTYLNRADIENIDNIESTKYYVSHPRKFMNYMYKLVGYYAAPYVFKPSFLFYTSEFENTVDSTNSRFIQYTDNDPRFYQDFCNSHLSLSDVPGCFKLYHLSGSHTPYRMDENAIESEDSSLPQQTNGCFKIISDYVDEMKQLGIYDDSTIIVTADHGGLDMYQNPAVFIKRAHDTGSMPVNEDPLTFKNIRASFVADIPAIPNAQYGEDAFSYTSGNEQRFLTADSDIKWMRTGISEDVPYISFIIGNPARDTSQVVEVEREKYIYHMGDEIYFYGDNRAFGLDIEGFAKAEGSKRWTTETDAYINLPLDSLNKSALVLNASIDVFQSQDLLIYINDYIVGKYNVTESADLQIEIPKEYVNTENINIHFAIPNAKSPKELDMYDDYRLLGISLTSLRFDAVPDDKITLFNHYVLGNDISFQQDNNTAYSYFISGLSTAEPNGTWTEGTKSEIKLHLGTGADSKSIVASDIQGDNLTLNVQGKTFYGNQKVQIYVGNTFIAEETLNGDFNISYDIPVNLIDSYGSLDITLELPDAISPSDVGVNEDPRKLALFLKNMSIN